MVRENVVEELKKEFGSWLDSSNTVLTKDYIIEKGITAEEIYTALLEAMKEHENWFEDYEKVNFNVEKVSWFDEKEGEWKPYDDDSPLYNTFEVLDDEEDIVEALEKRKDEVIKLINRALKELLETEDWEEDNLAFEEHMKKYKVLWALNIYLT